MESLRTRQAYIDRRVLVKPRGPVGMGRAAREPTRYPSTLMPESLLRVLLVGIGGGLGAMSRYGLGGLAHAALGPRFPFGTLLPNVLGCLLVGVLAYFLFERQTLTPSARLLLMVGFLGGMTTFSTFGYETIVMIRERELLMAGINVVANLVLSLTAVWIGWFAARAVWG